MSAVEMVPGPVSATSFVVEPRELWNGVPDAPRWDDGDDPGWLIGDYRCQIPCTQWEAVLADSSSRGSAPAQLRDVDPSVFDAAGRLEAQDRVGVAAEVLYPTPRLWGAIALVAEPATEIACVQVYNDWLASFVSEAPERLVGVAQIPSQGGIDAAVEECQRAAGLGLRGVILRAYPNGEGISEADDPFWAEVEARGLVVCVDGSFGPSLLPVVPHLNLSDSPSMLAITQLLYHGVFERFPALRVVVSTPSAGSLPHWLEKVDDTFLRYPNEFTLDRSVPSDDLRRFVYYTFSGEDIILDYGGDYMSSSHLLWSSQYPTMHFAEATDSFEALGSSDAASVAAMLGGTTRTLYGLPQGTPLESHPTAKPLPHVVPV